MPMSVEDRKNYNEKYYAEHKKDITEKLLMKVECIISIMSSSFMCSWMDLSFFNLLRPGTPVSVTLVHEFIP